MNRLCILAKLVVGLCLIFAAPAQAQNAAAPGELRVITRQISPFVIKDGDSYKGFSVELWAAIAKEIGRPFHYVDKRNITEILNGMSVARVMLPLPPFRSRRSARRSSTFPSRCLNSGLQILTRNEQGNRHRCSSRSGLCLTSNSTLFVLGLLAALIIVPAHIGWLVERKKENHLFPTSLLSWHFSCHVLGHWCRRRPAA